jgi:cytochrome c oxidase assembly factor CtaG
MSPIWLAVVALVGLYVWIAGGRVSARSCWFAAAMLILLVAFISPIGVLSDGYLFSAHMVQHLLLLLVVPLYLLLSLPPHKPADRIDRPGLRWLRWLSIPVVGWMCGIGAMWLWHVPALCSAATESYALGIIRSTTFLLAGLAFWWPVYSPVERLRLPPMSAVVYLFSACLGCTLLGIYITFTTVSVCPAFANPTDRIAIVTRLYQMGLTPGVDQQLGGLLMWVPPCSLYVCAIISILHRWYTANDAQAQVLARGPVTITEAT